VSGFEIAGDDHKFSGAQARIDGDTVVVRSDRTPHPVAVRYAWGMNPSRNLYNRAGLPASPFRTDDWEE
jgi:sialate O-acetylesterase